MLSFYIDILKDEDNHEEGDARRRFFEVVLLFEDTFDKDAFIAYVYLHKDDFPNKFAALEGEYSWIETKLNRRIVSIERITG